MADDEQLVAERVVATDPSHTLSVRIFQHRVEEFYRVEVASVAVPDLTASATVAAGDSFLMNLISEAVTGEQVAWGHLAHWGRDNLSLPGRVPPRCFS